MTTSGVGLGVLTTKAVGVGVMFPATGAAVGDGVGAVDGATVEVGAGVVIAMCVGDAALALALALVVACGAVQAPSDNAIASAAISRRMSRDYSTAVMAR